MSIMTETAPYPVVIERLKSEYTERYAQAMVSCGIRTLREHIRQYLRDMYPEYHDRFCDEDYRSTVSEFDNKFHPKTLKRRSTT